MEIYVCKQNFSGDEVTSSLIWNLLAKLDGENCSEFHIRHEDKSLYIAGDGKRARVQYTSDLMLKYLEDGNVLDDELWITLSNGEHDCIPFTETISFGKAVEVAQYFLMSEGKLLEEFI
jgi:hypothetical protein